MEGFLGEIRLFAFSRAPRDWALCNGAIVNVSQYQGLYTLLGNSFGGVKNQTFGLPDLRGRVPVQINATDYILGYAAGQESVTLTADNLPAHNHLVCVDNGLGTSPVPTGNIPAQSMRPGNAAAAAPAAPFLYGSNTTGMTTLDPSVILSDGSGQPHENRQPFLAINYCICTVGFYPPRN